MDSVILKARMPSRVEQVDTVGVYSSSSLLSSSLLSPSLAVLGAPCKVRQVGLLLGPMILLLKNEAGLMVTTSETKQSKLLPLMVLPRMSRELLGTSNRFHASAVFTLKAPLTTTAPCPS